MADDAPIDFAALGKQAAQRAWEEHNARGTEPPRYLDVHLWLAIADRLRARGVIEQLDRRAHAAIVAGYQRELEQLKVSAQVWPRAGGG